MPTEPNPAIHWLDDFGVWEHLLVINPTLDVTEKIDSEKKKFKRTYQDAAVIIGNPHITLAAFLANEQMEPTLTRWIQNICNGQSRFPITLRDFSGFVPHTIYIKVQNQAPFKQLGHRLKALDHFIRASDCPPLNIKTTPHLTIAQGLSEETYFKALPTYLQGSFQERFMATELTLFRRATSIATCVTVQRFPLAPEAQTFFN